MHWSRIKEIGLSEFENYNQHYLGNNKYYIHFKQSYTNIFVVSFKIQIRNKIELTRNSVQTLTIILTDIDCEYLFVLVLNMAINKYSYISESKTNISLCFTFKFN